MTSDIIQLEKVKIEREGSNFCADPWRWDKLSTFPKIAGWKMPGV
jgi:hypothetical protein